MTLALPIDAEDALDGVFLSVVTLLGFLGGGLVGLLIGFAAGYTYITWTDRIADLEATVNALIREKETLRQRIEELEADDTRRDGVTDGGVEATHEYSSRSHEDDSRSHENDSRSNETPSSR